MLGGHSTENHYAHHYEKNEEYDGNNENWHTSPLPPFSDGYSGQAVMVITEPREQPQCCHHPSSLLKLSVLGCRRQL
jgi:hypothetical protein